MVAIPVLHLSEVRITVSARSGLPPLALLLREAGASETMKVGSVLEAAAQEHVDVATVRRWIHQKGCTYVIRKGRRGPGNAAVLDLEKLKACRGTAQAPAGLTHEEALQKIAQALLDSLHTDHADIRADTSRETVAAVLLVAFERCCKSFGYSFKLDERPEPIRALMREL